MSYAPQTIPIPDLRFEQSFLRSLHNYANPPNRALKESELAKLDDENEEDKELPDFKPIAPITPGIVALAVIKDQIFMPLIQGFLWSGFLLSLGPLTRLAVASGRASGLWLFRFLGLAPRRPVY